MIPLEKDTLNEITTYPALYFDDLIKALIARGKNEHDLKIWVELVFDSL